MKMKWQEITDNKRIYPHYHKCGVYEITEVKHKFDLENNVMFILNIYGIEINTRELSLPECKHLCKKIELKFGNDEKAARQYLSKATSSDEAIKMISEF